MTFENTEHLILIDELQEYKKEQMDIIKKQENSIYAQEIEASKKDLAQTEEKEKNVLLKKEIENIQLHFENLVATSVKEKEKSLNDFPVEIEQLKVINLIRISVQFKD